MRTTTPPPPVPLPLAARLSASPACSDDRRRHRRPGPTPATPPTTRPADRRPRRPTPAPTPTTTRPPAALGRQRRARRPRPARRGELRRRRRGVGQARHPADPGPQARGHARGPAARRHDRAARRAGADGRAIVARGLASGDLYLPAGPPSCGSSCASTASRSSRTSTATRSPTAPHAADAELAAFIRDNDAAGTDFGQSFTLGDVLESSLRLDDLSPLYRADMFARMARPLQGANISQEEFEVNARSNFGEIFESAYLGRRSGCLECHNSEESVTYSPDPQVQPLLGDPRQLRARHLRRPRGPRRGRALRDVPLDRLRRRRWAAPPRGA
jgi:hypothetical protein